MTRAAVSNAASAQPGGQKWFKIWHDGLDVAAGTWAIDKMINNNGWVDFTLPSCVAPGDYLLKVELLGK